MREGICGRSVRSCLALALGMTVLLCSVAAAQSPATPDAEAADDGVPFQESPADAPASGDPEMTRCAVLVLSAAGSDPAIGDQLTEVAIAAVAARGNVAIVGKEEFQAQLDQGEAEARACLGSAACLSRVGVELRVDEIVAGTVGSRPDGFVFNLNRIDARSGQLTGRAFREVEGDLGAAARALREAIPSLYEAVDASGTLVVSPPLSGAEVHVDGVLVGVTTSEGVRVTDLAAGPHEVWVVMSGHYDWRRTVRVAGGTTLEITPDLIAIDGEDPGPSPVLYFGLGMIVAGAGTAIVFGALSQRDPAQDATRAEAIDFVDGRKTDALLSNIGLAVIGGGVITTAIGLLLSTGDDGPEGPGELRGSVRASSDGAVFGLSGAF